MRCLFFLIVFFLGVGTIHPLFAQQYSLRQYTVVDGLPQSQVNTLVEDRLGYLWIGTNGGLARFDGRDFKVYNTLDGLLSNSISSLTIDSHENLWIVHPRGLTRFDGVRFKKFQAPAQASGVRRVSRVFELNDTLIVLSRPGVLGKIYKDSVYYWDKPVGENKMIYFAQRTPKMDVCFYLNDSSFLIFSRDGKRKVISHKKHFGRAMNILNYNNDLLIDTDSGFFTLDIEKSKFSKEALDFGRHVVAYDSLNSNFWTWNEKVLRKESKDNKSKSENVLSDIDIRLIYFDGEGNSWFGTNGNGLYKYYARDFDRCASEKLKAVTAIEKDRSGAVWIGSQVKGMWKIHNGKVKTYPLGDINEVAVMDIKQSPKGEIWVASYGGLGKYDSIKDTFTWYKREQGLSSQYVTSLTFDKEGGLWCGTSGVGLNYFNQKEFKSYSVEEGLLGRNISSIYYFDKTNTLYAGSEFGLNTITNGKVTEIKIPELVNTSILSIHSFKDSLIMLGSSGAGIAFLDPASKKTKLINTRDGLLSDFIYFVSPDEDDRLWIGTEKGINRIKLNDQLEIIESLHYGFENGLTGVEVNQNAFFLGKEKYFGLIDGVYQYNELPKRSHYSYNLHLTDVEIFYGQFTSREFADSSFGFFKIPFQPSLPPDKNHITFHFNRIDKRYPASIKYKYLLENFDKTWSMPSPTGQVTYSNLPHGAYVLNVLATNEQGSWDTKPIRYSFIIETPFYKTTAFIGGMIILALGSISLYFYFKVRKNVRMVLEVERIRQQEQDNLRKEIARDFHDEMGNQLTRIINYISLIKLNGNGHAVDLYNKVEDSAKYLYTGTKDFIWSIDPVNDELVKLFIHIRDFGEKLFEEKGIKFRAYNEIKESIKIPYGYSREANLIMKEAMTNAFNHSNAENVSFTLRQDADKFELVLTDDGRGFDMAAIPRLNGIKNMRTRAERMRTTLRIQSSTNQTGTTISLILSKTKTTTSWQSLSKKES